MPTWRPHVSLAETLLVGAGLGLSLAVPPGPVLTKMALEVARGHPWRGVRVGLGASTADLSFFLGFWLLADRLRPADWLLGLLGLGGLALMDWLAFHAFRAARLPEPPAPRRLDGFAAGYLLAATSPINIAWWLGAGLVYLDQYGALLGVGFFGAIFLWVFICVLLFMLAQRHVPGFRRGVGYAGAGLLTLFGAILAYRSLGLLWG